MRPGGSNQKGAAFERHVCKHLSMFVSKGQRDDLFWRTAMSGGRATLGYRTGKNRSAQAGDIAAIDPLGSAFTSTFLVECKCYQELDIAAFLLGTGGKLRTFWTKLFDEAIEMKRVPLLIAKQNRFPAFVILPHTTPPPFRFLEKVCLHPNECFITFEKFLTMSPEALCGHYQHAMKIKIIRGCKENA